MSADAAVADAPIAMPRLSVGGLLRRRRKAMLYTFVAAAILAISLAMLWPPTYLSTGTILIEQQEVPTDLVRSTISSYADQRIQVISQRVMTTSNLMRIIQQYDLYPKQRKRDGRETIISKMRSDVKFKTISADVIDPRQGKPTQATIAFTLGYQSRSPELAARVANEISSLFLQENLESRKQLTQEATTFLTEEADRLEKQIAETEQHLADFKEQHLHNLPELSQINLQLASRLDDEQRDIDSQLHSHEAQLLYLDSQLSQVSRNSQLYTATGERVLSPADRLRMLRSEYSRAVALYSADHPDVTRLKREIAALETEAQIDHPQPADTIALKEAEAQLLAARQRYSDDHPDVIRLERLVTTLREGESKDASTPAPAANTTAPAPAASKETADNPSYIQLQTQREILVSERDALMTKRRSLDGRRAELEHRIESSPGVERDYLDMHRDLENLQAKYREVRQKQMEAQLAESLESERKGERLSLIEPPIVPEEPASPNRPLVMTLGLVMAVILSVSIGIGLEQMDDSVRGSGDIAWILTAPPLAVIPRFTEASFPQARRRTLLWVAGAAGAGGLCALAGIHFFYRPLDILWATLLARFGA